MAISLNHEDARKILFAEAEAAGHEVETPAVKIWKTRVTSLGELCPHGKSATVVAALGTAILAKATDPRVDVYSLLDRAEADNSYSARSLADNVWARHRAILNVDLGANGANPLNNTPFIGKTRIDEISGVRNQRCWRYFMRCIGFLEALPTATEAREALRGFVMARSRSLLAPPAVDPGMGDSLTAEQLLRHIEQYVREDSEGGRRAQACAAALLDACFGPTRVSVGVINDPDRRAPLDVSVIAPDGHTALALEVKDKPIEGHHIIASVERTVTAHNVRNLTFIAVSANQQQTDFGDESRWAAQHGVKVTVFLNWDGFFRACKCFATSTERVFEGVVLQQILQRGSELGADRQRLEQLCARALGRAP